MKRSLFFSALPYLVCPSIALSAQYINIDEQNFNQHFNHHPANQSFSSTENANDQFRLVKKVTLPDGTVKNKYIQYYQGVPVYATIITSSETKGAQTKWFGSYLDKIKQDNLTVRPNFTAAEIIQKAKEMMRLPKETPTSLEKADLFVDLNRATNTARLVYRVSFNIPEHRPHFIIDALTGQLIHQWDGLTTKDAQGPGGNTKTGQYYYGKDYPSLQVSDSCAMQTDTVETYNMNSQTSGGKLFQFTCPENTYKQINGAYSPLNDAHFFGQVIVDMYKQWYNMSPLNIKLKMRVHYGKQYENAYWDGKQMTFGDGGSDFYPLTALDVAAHEVSHGVTEQNSNLDYEYQPGGINEAFSDMAGETAEYFMQSKAGKENDWMVGASIVKGSANTALRYFQDPTLDGHSIANAKDYNDALDVHYTSGVFNKAFYNLATQSSWGIRKAFEVFLLANKIYWKNNSNFDEAACGVSKAADDLHYDVSDVVNSFQSVGVNANCVTPDPKPDPSPAETKLQNGQIVNNITMKKGEERRFVIEVPVLTKYPYNYKYLYLRVYDDVGSVKDEAELFVRYDAESMTSSWQKMAQKDEAFYLSLPSAGFYHLMIKAKKDSSVNLQAFYSTK